MTARVTAQPVLCCRILRGVCPKPERCLELPKGCYLVVLDDRLERHVRWAQLIVCQRGRS